MLVIAEIVNLCKAKDNLYMTYGTVRINDDKMLEEGIKDCFITSQDLYELMMEQLVDVQN